MVSICPTITAETSEAYRDQIHEVALFATRLHIDVSDGSLAPNKLLDVNDVWWPGGVRADIHAMLREPFKHLDTYIALGPQMVIVHAEADGDFVAFADALHGHGIEVGVALLPATPVNLLAPAIDMVDHVLVFSGKLGHFGGQADTKLYEKVRQVRALSSRVEIGWDGGINDTNAPDLVAAGVEVLNIGGFIHNADNPQRQYESLARQLSALHN